MEDIAMLGLGVDSRPVDHGRESLKKFEDQAGRTELATRGLEHTTGLLTRAMGLLGAAFSVSELIRMTSVWTDLNSRVRNAVSAHESANDVMNRIDEMARRTYSSLEQTAESYLRNSAALTALGYSTAQQLDLTESLNNALVVSAIKGQQAESVMNAWSKAMALGKLEGDNLNTVIMSGGRVAEALADSMGVSVLQLRKLGAEGKITSEEMFGVTSELEKLREEADAMPATIQDAFTLLGNALTSTVGRLDEATGASTAVADAIILIGDNADALVPIIGALAGIIGASLIPSIVGATTAMIAFAASPIGLLVIGVGALAGAVTYLWNEQRLAAQAAQEHADNLAANATGLDQAKDGSQRFREALRGQITDQLAAADAALEEADAQFQVAKNRALAAGAFDDFMNILGTAFGMDTSLGAGNKERYTAAIMGNAESQIETAKKRVADLRAQLAELDQIMTTPPGKDDPTVPKDPTKDEARALKSYDKLVEATQHRVESLEAEATALGLTHVEALTLTNAQDLLAQAEKSGVPITEARTQQIMAFAEAMTDAQLAVEGMHIQLENRTPWEVMAEEIENLQELLDRGKIGVDDFAVGIGSAVEDMVSNYVGGANDVLGNIEKITDAMGLEGKKAFEVQKALGIARAVVSGAESITHSFNAGTAIGGPPLGFAFAGIAAAATAAQIAALASTSYQSKSVPSASGGGASVAPQQPVAPATPAESRTVTIVLPTGQRLFSDTQIEQLIRELNDKAGDGLTIQTA